METANQIPRTVSSNVIWQPQPKQAVALSCPAFELLYGGAAGGGKSDFLLADYLSGINQWGREWKGILFRKTYAELEEIISRARDIYIPLGARFNEAKATFIFPNGATLKLRYLERMEDVTHYQGHQYTWVGFDELGNYTSDYCWRFMVSRCRSAAGAPCFIRGTANPGGVGHSWIKVRFIDGYVPNRIYVDPETELTRCFIPSTLEDNQALMVNDPQYAQRMKLLPPQLYRAMRFGNWDVFAGQVFEEFAREKNGAEWHVIKPFALNPGQWFKFAALDWGYAKPFSIGWWAVNSDGRMIRYRELYGCDPKEQNVGVRRGALDVAQEAWAISAPEGVSTIVVDGAIRSKDDEGPSIWEQFESVGWNVIAGNKDRVNGIMQFHQSLMNTGEDGRPMLLVFNTCYAFIRTIPTLLPDPNHPEDIDSKLEDHVYDESRYAIMSEFAKNPVNALRKQNGSYTFATQKKTWDPLRGIQK
jgi:hypothetical protein